MTISTGRPPFARRATKRALDVVVSLLALPVFLIVMLVIAIPLKLDSPGPVLYHARRVGRDMRMFDILKIRTMTCESRGPGITRSGDARITRIGRWLRGSKLDELPQIINVLKGDMSLVGPRPEDPRYIEAYSVEQREVLSVRPGLTCLAFLRFGHEQAFIERAQPADVETFYVTEVLPEKLAIELEYVRGWSIWGDLAIMARTFIGLFARGT